VLEGNASETSDAEQAYLHSRLKGPKTRAQLPLAFQPAAWAGRFRQPVEVLELALYSRPDSGVFWEEFCDDKVVEAGFVSLGNKGWRSCYWRSERQCFLLFYVDGFKLSRPVGVLPKVWKLLSRGIALSKPEPIRHYLG
jgi:hypothetical protein